MINVYGFFVETILNVSSPSGLKVLQLLLSSLLESSLHCLHALSIVTYALSSLTQKVRYGINGVGTYSCISTTKGLTTHNSTRAIGSDAKVTLLHVGPTACA